ncbi:hypothetical protein AMK59_6070, partial [Oryctes borbonicus]
MAKNTKTPVMVLQELAVKRNIVPEYELIFSQQGTHENEFRYQVTLLGEQAVGIGRSKKEAKHEAARKALEQLAEKGIYHPDMTNNHVVGLDVRQDQIKAPLNCIPKLIDICIENKIPLAEFVEISDVGPPHRREFTYECRVSRITTRAIAGSKKHAKQLAAKDMLDRIYNIIPELQQETDKLILCDDEVEVLRKYKNLSANFNPVKTNFNSKAAEYDLQFKKLIVDFNINTATVMKILEQPPSEKVLQEFVDLFDIKFEMKPLQQSVPIFMVNIHSETPLTILGTSFNMEAAE